MRNLYNELINNLIDKDNEESLQQFGDKKTRCYCGLFLEYIW